MSPAVDNVPTDAAAPSALPVYRSIEPGRVPRPCGACGFDLRAHHPHADCPECGTAPGQVRAARLGTGQQLWAVKVLAGVVLLLLAIGPAAWVIFSAGYWHEKVGTVAWLNVPGPKLWGGVLLQRSLGEGPGPVGLLGVKAAMISFAGLLLVTSRGPHEAGERRLAVRRVARWGGVVLLGLAVGGLLSADGISTWQSRSADGLPERGVWTLLLTLFVDLPTLLLIAWRLSDVARAVLQPSLASGFGLVRWLAPACVLATSLRLWVELGQPRPAWNAKIDTTAALISGLLAAVNFAVGTLAVLATVRLGAALLPRALQELARLKRRALPLGSTRRLLRRLALQQPATRQGQLALGIALWVLACSYGLLETAQVAFRHGLWGNLPLSNFVGPKVWVAHFAAEMGYSGYSWRAGLYLDHAVPLMAGMLMAGAVWLITSPTTTPAPASAEATRLLARWVSLAGLVLALGLQSAGDLPVKLSTSSASTRVAMVVLLAEAPATLLLLRHLAHLAGGLGLNSVTRSLRRGGWAATGLILLPLGAYPLSGYTWDWHDAFWTHAAGGVYVASGLVVAVSLLWPLAQLAGAAFLTAGGIRMAGMDAAVATQPAG